MTGSKELSVKGSLSASGRKWPKSFSGALRAPDVSISSRKNVEHPNCPCCARDLGHTYRVLQPCKNGFLPFRKWLNFYDFFILKISGKKLEGFRISLGNYFCKKNLGTSFGNVPWKNCKKKFGFLKKILNKKWKE